MIVDCHMHLRGSDDLPRGRYSADRVEEYVEQARATGVVEIGFSDHIYYFRQAESLWEIPWMLERVADDLDDYVTAVEEAKRRRLPVKLGLEVDCGLFDVLSHPDLVKIFGRRPDADETRGLHVEVADAVAEAGVCVEVSAAGLHKPVGELYPDREHLALCHERGVPITLASDAHRPEHVGRDVDRAAELAREVGYETVTVFDRRERRQEPLG